MKTSGTLPTVFWLSLCCFLLTALCDLSAQTNLPITQTVPPEENAQGVAATAAAAAQREYDQAISKA